jgi:hypothetical protein
MNRKIIIKSFDFDREICHFLNEIGADMPIEWNTETLDPIRDAVIETFVKMGVILEIDDRNHRIPSSYIAKREVKTGMLH